MKTEKTQIVDQVEGLSELWRYTLGSKDVCVAVLDGPCDIHSQSLVNASLVQLDAPTRFPASFHGTFVNSIIFGAHDGPIKGVSPHCQGVVKNLYHEDKNGELRHCSQADIARAIQDVIECDIPVHVINISGGELIASEQEIMPVLANALEQCEERDILVVAATGNEGVSNVHVPASYPTVLAVGATDERHLPACFSNWSSGKLGYGLVTQGEGINGALPTTYTLESAQLNGTSFSAAVVSGIAGLLLSLQKQIGQPVSPLLIRDVLVKTTRPCTLENPEQCQRLLLGELDLPAACSALLGDALPLFQPAPNTQTQQGAFAPSVESFLNVKDIEMQNETSSQSSNIAPDSAPTREVAPAAAADSAVMPSSFNPASNQGSYPTFENSALVAAIGQISYDFGIEANRDIFHSALNTWFESLPSELRLLFTPSPYDHLSMAAFLLYDPTGNTKDNLYFSSQLIWLLTLDTAPVYSITPQQSAFNDFIYPLLARFLADSVGLPVELYQKACLPNATEGVMSKFSAVINGRNQSDLETVRMVLPGYVSGNTQLFSRTSVQSVTPVAYGLAEWTIDALTKGQPEETKKQVEAILNRLYLTAQNKGQTADERALNYFVYNVINLSDIVIEAAKKNLQFSSYEVVPSKIQRQHSELRQVQLTFFNPANTNEASTTYATTMDVSGITPITVGKIESWQSPVSVAKL